ncbi:MAG: hypothetical protein ABJG14_11015 [Sulfitobacter sp.]|uniref:hypothetical protein n=1 Tax=Sulfitobacter sp. TaxID=1903071 RepID=UPI00326536B2
MYGLYGFRGFDIQAAFSLRVGGGDGGGLAGLLDLAAQYIGVAHKARVLVL